MTLQPRILCIGGHDPTGGAGIQADIETITALGGRAFTLVSCLTAQDTANIDAILPTPTAAFARQADLLLADIEMDVIKLGVLGSPGVAGIVAELLRGFDGPVVLDPVLAAGGGFDLDGNGEGSRLLGQLLPRVHLLTPNRAELRRLSGCEDEDQAVATLLGSGAAVLVTGADEAEGEQVVNVLHTADGTARKWTWPRLPHSYHGSGCTLASACACGLALGLTLEAAVEQAQAFTWQALNSGQAVGKGQWLPDRHP